MFHAQEARPTLAFFVFPIVAKARRGASDARIPIPNRKNRSITDGAISVCRGNAPGRGRSRWR